MDELMYFTVDLSGWFINLASNIIPIAVGLFIFICGAKALLPQKYEEI